MQLRSLAFRFATVVLAATGLVVSPARAEDDAAEDGNPAAADAAVSFSVSLQAFYAGMPDPIASLDPFGPGLGVRAGLTLPSAVYLGVSYEHFFGADPQSPGPESEASLDEVQAWLGYDLALDGVSIRPMLGAGYVRSHEEWVVAPNSVEGPSAEERSTSSAHGVVFSPTLQLAFPVGPAWLLLDGRYAIIPEAVANGDALMIGVGFGVAL